MQTCKRCGLAEEAHKFHPEKNPNRAGTTTGSRCKGFVPNEVGEARELHPEAMKGKK